MAFIAPFVAGRSLSTAAAVSAAPSPLSSAAQRRGVAPVLVSPRAAAASVRMMNQAGSGAGGNYEGVRLGPPPDLPSLLLHNRIIYLGMPLVAAVTELIIAEFLYLQYEDAEKPITLYINSTGRLGVLVGGGGVAVYCFLFWLGLHPRARSVWQSLGPGPDGVVCALSLWLPSTLAAPRAVRFPLCAAA